jgi:TPR repeat protein
MPLLPGAFSSPSREQLPADSLEEKFLPDTVQPALGRTLSQLADLYMARRIDRATVDRHLSEYQQILRAVGADALVAVSAPTPQAAAIADQPDGNFALELYERATAFGYPSALIGIGNLYARGQIREGPQPQKAFEAFARAAAQGNQLGKLRVAELTILGEGTERDVQAGLAALESLAKADDVHVLHAIATLCLSGRIPVQSDLALTVLERAALLGSGDAHVQLGDLYSEGEDVVADYPLAAEHYRQAAARGNIDAIVRLDEMRARGQGTARDVAGAVTELEDLRKGGQARASLALGDLYGTGEVVPIKPALAVSYYELAARQGSVTALLRLGDGYREGRFGSRDRAKAADFYRRASEAGNRGAAVTLGFIEASSGRKRVAAIGAARLRQAANEGINGAAVALAEAMFYGYGTTPDTPGALSLLQEARSKRDRQSLLALVSAYRDGKRDGKIRVVRKDPKKADALLASSLDMLTVPAANVQRFLLTAATANTIAFADLNRRLMAMSQPERRQVMRSLPKANANLFVYAVKARFKEMSAYRGSSDGRLSAPFITSVAKYCRSIASKRQCNRGPLDPDVVEFVSYAF